MGERTRIERIALTSRINQPTPVGETTTWTKTNTVSSKSSRQDPILKPFAQHLSEQIQAITDPTQEQ